MTYIKEEKLDIPKMIRQLRSIRASGPSEAWVELLCVRAAQELDRLHRSIDISNEDLKAQRDDARRMVCMFEASKRAERTQAQVRGKYTPVTPQRVAFEFGWDCFPEGNA